LGAINNLRALLAGQLVGAQVTDETGFQQTRGQREVEPRILSAVIVIERGVIERSVSQHTTTAGRVQL